MTILSWLFEPTSTIERLPAVKTIRMPPKLVITNKKQNGALMERNKIMMAILGLRKIYLVERIHISRPEKTKLVIFSTWSIFGKITLKLSPKFEIRKIRFFRYYLNKGGFFRAFNLIKLNTLLSVIVRCTNPFMNEIRGQISQ